MAERRSLMERSGRTKVAISPFCFVVVESAARLDAEDEGQRDIDVDGGEEQSMRNGGANDEQVYELRRV
jgi:hypothetical protein